MTNLDARSRSADSGNASNQQPPPPHPDRTGEPTGSSGVRLAMVVASVVLLGVWAGLSALIVVLAIVIMIFLHELGHFVTAKAAGMKCTEFFIGFGPRIWSFTRGETEYGLKAIPAGAYVKVIGMTNLEDVDPEEEHRTYRHKPYWRRMSVAVAGSAMHFILALVCLLVLFAAIGVGQDDVWEVGELATVDGAPGPAGLAGIEVGDRFLAFDGEPVATWGDVLEEIRGRSPGDTLVIAVERGGERLDIEVTLGSAGTGIDGTESERAFLGVRVNHPPQPMSPPAAVGEAVTEFGNVSFLTVEAITRIFSPAGMSNFVGLAVDTTRPADPSAEPVPIEEQDRVMSIYGAARLGSQMTDAGPAGLLLFLALINIFIGIFNLLPLLPLDGGHVAIATYERIRELASRSKQRYHADVSKLIPLTYAVIIVLIGIGVVALYLDIVDPFDLPG